MELSVQICHVFWRATIAGVDPGTTAGWAVLSLDGEVLAVGSGRDAGVDTILEKLIPHGSPAVVATDVHPAPETVEKVATSVDAELWEPDESLSVEEKRELAGDATENDHERDALAAALKAYQDHLDLFRKVEKRTPSDISEEKVKRRALQGETIAEVIEDLRSPDEEDGDEGEPERKVEEETLLSRQARTISRLRDRLESAEDEVEDLRGELEEAKEAASEARSRDRREAMKSREVRRLRERNEELREKLDDEKRRASRLSKRLGESERSRLVERRGFGLVAYRLTDLTRGEAERVAATFDLSGHPVYVETGSGAGKSGVDVLDENDVEAVIVRDSLPHHARERLFEHEIPSIDADELSIRTREGFVILDEEGYGDALEAAEDRLAERKDRELIGILEDVTEKMRS